MKALLFDFGGTIDTGGTHWSEKFWKIYERLNVPVGKGAFEGAFVCAEEELSRDPALARLTFRETLCAQLSAQMRLLALGDGEKYVAPLTRACYDDVCRTIAGARTLLEELHASGYRMALVSNFTGNLGLVCREFGLDAVFDVLIDSALVGVRKPDPAIFALALERLGVPPESSIVIGDSYERDIVPGKHLGCSTIWLRGKSWRYPEETSAADVTVNSFSALREVLLPVPAL